MPSAAELRAAFAAFDSDGNGVLTYDEISGIFTRPGGGKPMTEEEAMAWVEKYAKSGAGTLDLDEFKSVVGHLMGAQEKYDDAKVEAEFTRADKNASGTIDAAELRGVLGTLGHALGKKYVASVLK